MRICTFIEYMYIYLYQSIVELLSSHERKGNSVIYNNTDGLEEIMVSEISQTEKSVFCIISVIQKSKITSHRGVVARAGCWGKWGHID